MAPACVNNRMLQAWWSGGRMEGHLEGEESGPIIYLSCTSEERR